VLAADPDAAKKRKEQALREARVERWTEPAGTAALAGRDLPPAGVLAADANLTACRHHHQVKQTPGWNLDQTSPGVLTWTTPSGRRYTIGPTSDP
jgi:hypothetical protein